MSFPSTSFNAVRSNFNALQNPICYLVNGASQVSGVLSSEATAILNQLMLIANPWIVTAPSLVSYKIKPVSNPSSSMIGGASGAAATGQLQGSSRTFLFSSSPFADSPLRKDFDQLFLKANPGAITSPSLVSYEITQITNPLSYMVTGSTASAASVSAPSVAAEAFTVEDVTNEEYPKFSRSPDESVEPK